MGIQIKITGSEEITLTDFTVENCMKKCEDLQGRNEFLSNNILGIALWGKYSAYDKGLESLEVNKLSTWCKVTAHEDNVYRMVELNLYDNDNNLYDTLTFKKAFITDYKENYKHTQGFMSYYVFIRRFEATEAAIKK